MASFIKGGRYKNKYRCGTVTYQGKNACYDVKINKEDLESEIINQIKSRFTPESVDLLVDEVTAAIEAETGNYKDTVKKIDKEIKSKQNEINNLVNAVACGENIDLFNEDIEMRRQEMEELKKQKE
ncbi:MAG: hypothetical protein K9L17_06710 [Clostridiales bacterium]|nr:hypothetical protein [Clostridiales bacterium]MCF8022363.1 hypothetical protein [Clostridiales bacterium]